MKKISLLAIVALFVMTTSCKKDIGTSETEITFETEKHDFGTITQGEKVVYAYEADQKKASEVRVKDVNAKGALEVKKK